MFGINRFEATNYVNGRGDDPKLPWMPRFCGTILPFYGLSTALRLDNGGGKTSLANAIVGLISRDRALMSRVYACLPPHTDKSGHWGHVRIELIDLTEDALQARPTGQSTFTAETWVFGLCGFRGRGRDRNYYFYRGTFEDAPTIGTLDGVTGLLPNGVFQKSVRGGDRASWGVTESDWRRQMDLFIASGNAKKLAEYQKAGSGDQAAQFFDLKKRDAERFDQTFFYDVLAPEIMSGIMGDVAEKDEHYLEDTIFKSLYRSIQNERDIETAKKEFDRCKRVQESTHAADAAAGEAEAAQKRYDGQYQSIALTLAALREQISNDPLPGLPTVSFPDDDLTGQLARHTVIGAGKGVLVRDVGLAAASGLKVRRLNEIASRNQLKGTRITQVIEPTCDLRPVSADDKGHRSVYYSIDDAQRLLPLVPNLRPHVRNDLSEALEIAYEWMTGATSTNPVRVELDEIEETMNAADDQVRRLGDEITRLSERISELDNEHTEFEEGRQAYLDVRSSPFFEPEEAEHADKLVYLVDEERQEAQKEMNAFTARSARLEPLLPDWAQFVAEFGSEADPALVHQQLQAEHDSAEERYRTARRQTQEARDGLDTTKQARDATKREQDEAEARHEHLVEQQAVHQRFAEAFPETRASGFEEDQRKTLQACSDKRADLKREIERLQDLEHALLAFRTQQGQDADPAAWLQQADARREQAGIERHEKKAEGKELKAQLEALEADELAAPDARYRAALQHLSETDIPAEPLHEFIDGLSLPGPRRAEVLTHFSALLFAPVGSDAAGAERAAASLEAAEMRLPCFVGRELVQYAREGRLDVQDNRATGLLAGLRTLDVECLLDPAKIEERKEDLRAQIAAADQAIERLEAERRRLAPEGKAVSNAREARDALTANVETRLPEARTEHGDNEATAIAINERLTGNSLAMIRGAAAFEQAGGNQAVVDAKLAVERAANATRRARERVETAEGRLNMAETSQLEADEARGQAYPPEQRRRVDQAQTFVKLKGPAWQVTREEQGQRIEATLDRAQNRVSFQQTLKRAAKYVDIRQRRADGQTPEQERADAQRAREQKTRLLREAQQQLEQARGDRPRYVKARDAVDHALAELLQQDRLTRSFSAELKPGAIDGGQLAEHEICIASGNLRHALRVMDLHDIEETAGELAVKLRELDLEHKRRSLRDHRADRNRQVGRMLELINSLRAEDSDLGPSEREHLRPVEGLDQADRVHRLAESYLGLREAAKEKLEAVSTAAQVSMDEAINRMGNLITSAGQHLRILQRVAKDTQDPDALRFEIKATALDRESAQELVRDIRTTIHGQVSVLQDDMNQARHHSSEDQRAEDQIRARIREMCYRRLFKDPSIRFSSPEIRGDGKFHELTQHLSTGQKTAMTLAWLIRLTEFSTERDSRRLPTAAARRKARENQQTIMLIDGLFSDLSKKKLIDAGMAEIQNTRGRLQVIGFIHPPEYVNNFDYFPVFLFGTSHSSTEGGWTNIEEQQLHEGVVIGKLRLEQTPGPGDVH